MAPNKMNHLEAPYSRSCDFRVIFYNIRTEYIRADRFQAFIRILPVSRHEPKVIRFLLPDQDGKVLRTEIGDDVNPPFEIELYVKFPESADPELFNIRVL